MAITQVGTAKGGGAINSADITLTFDTSPNNPIQGDLVVVWGGYSHAAAGDITPLPGPSTGGYTEIWSRADATNAEPAFGIWYKFMGATPDTNVVCRGSLSNTDASAYGCAVFRGVDQTTPQDQTAVTKITITGVPDGDAIVTVTDHAWIIVAAGNQVNDTTRGTVSGYTALAGGTANDTRAFSTDASRLDKTPAGSDNPAAWSSWTSGVYHAVTIALRPAAATPTRGQISWAELEVPFVPTRGRISWAEFEVPFVPTRGRISWAEFEAPLAPTRGRVSWVEFEVPSPPDPTRGLFSWAELETPFVATRGRISWVEFQVPDPLSPTRGLISWVEFEIPDAGGRRRFVGYPWWWWEQWRERQEAELKKMAKGGRRGGSHR